VKNASRWKAGCSRRIRSTVLTNFPNAMSRSVRPFQSIHEISLSCQ
jgi:hypothetical protein